MAYALKFSSVSEQYCQFTNPFSFLADTSWVIELRAKIPSGGGFTFLGSDSYNCNVSFTADSALRLRVNGGVTEEILNYFSFIDGDWHTYVIERDGDNLTVKMDDTTVVTQVSSDVAGWTSQSHDFKYIGRSSTGGYRDGDIEYLKINGAVVNHNWDATSSAHSGAVQLDDIVGSNHATGYNFPNNGTEWENLNPVAESLAITTADYTFRKKNGSSAIHTVEGTYLDNPTAIEYSVDGGAWQTGVASPTGGTFSFSVEIPMGESTVDVRFANDVAVTASVILVTPDLVITTAGQSNISSRGINNQTYTQANGVKAYLFGNDDQFKLLQDPYDSNVGQVDSVSSDPQAGGSWIVRFAHYWIQNKGTPIAIIPCPKGGTSVESWLSYQPLYESMERRINAVGGTDVVFYQQGETDSGSNTEQGTYESRLNSVIDDIKADFGADTFIIPLHTLTSDGHEGINATTGQDAIRVGQINVANSNPNASIGQPLTDIDVSDNDGTHFWRDDELDLIGSRMYDSFTGEVSNLTITATGIPDGIYNTVLVNSSNEIVHAGNVTYSSGQALLENLALTSGTPLTGFVVDNEISHSDGAVITGTTV